MQIDVSNLLSVVKEKGLLFYPVIIHILSKTLLRCGYHDIGVAYINSNQEKSLIAQGFDESFDIFFRQYVNNCFYNQSSCQINDKCILFSYLNPVETENVCKNLSTFILNPLIQQQEKTILPIQTKNISIKDNFISICQELCDNF